MPFLYVLCPFISAIETHFDINILFHFLWNSETAAYKPSLCLAYSTPFEPYLEHAKNN